MTAELTSHGTRTVASVLLERAATRPAAPFLIFDEHVEADGEGGAGGGAGRLDYRQAAGLARRGAAVLAGLGVGRGDRFAVVTGNRAEFFACWFGAALLGAVLVPADPAAPADELAHVIAHSGCRAAVVDAAHAGKIPAALRDRAVLSGDDFAARAAGGSPEPVTDLAPDEPLAVLYTSGSTGRPKGVVVTHANYLYAGEVVAQNLRMRPDDRWLVVLPLFHANAQYYCVMSALVTGASVVVARRFSASRWARQARRHRATLASLFAAPVRMILARPPAPDDADNRLRAALFAQNLTRAQLADFERRFGCPLLQLYGMTETIAPPLMNPLEQARDNMTLGLPTTAARVRVVGPGGAPVSAPGETGELHVGGHPGTTLMAGYLDDPRATAEAIPDGWLRTGDIVRIAPGGFLAFEDRAKDMIKRAGENIAAAEIERVVNAHPAVRESAAIGVPDAVRDEAIKVFAVLHDGAEATAEQIVAHCAERLAPFKVPGLVAFVDGLPRTPVGKIRKHLLRDDREVTR